MTRYIFVACLLCLFTRAMSQNDWHIVPGRITTPWAQQGNGACVYTTMIYPDAGAGGLTLLAKGGDFRVKELTIWNLGQ
jgi:hypothetical protein